jgi:hypothetical protein
MAPTVCMCSTMQRIDPQDRLAARPSGRAIAAQGAARASLPVLKSSIVCAISACVFITNGP